VINNAPIRDSLPVETTAGGLMRALWGTSWTNWFALAASLLQDIQRTGTTANRPTTGLYIGKFYFDTTLGHAIHYDGADWVDGQGNVV